MIRYRRLNENDATSFLRTSNTNFLNAYDNSQACDTLSALSRTLAYGNHFDTIRQAFLEVFYTLKELDIDVKEAGKWKEYVSGMGNEYFFEFDSNIYLTNTNEDEMNRALELIQDAWKNLGLSVRFEREEQLLTATINKLKVEFNATCGYYGDNRMCISMEILARV